MSRPARVVPADLAKGGVSDRDALEVELVGPRDEVARQGGNVHAPYDSAVRKSSFEAYSGKPSKNFKRNA